MQTDWELICDKNIFDSLKTTDEFGYVLGLARAVNALAYVHSTIPEANDADDSPVEVRARVNVFLFACSILCEARNLVEAMNPLFGNKQTFQGLQELLDDPAVQRLKLLRNKGVFHFDAKEFKLRARRSPSHNCSFSAGKGKFRNGAYNPFADALVIDMFLRLPDDPTLRAEQLAERENTEARKRLPEARDLTSRFVEMAEHFISESLKSWGFTLKDHSGPQALEAIK
jgi:hypothetical protein